MQNKKLSAIAAAACDAVRQAGALAADAAYGAGMAAEKQVSALRRRMRAAAVERQIGGKLAEVGEMLYATHTGTPTDSDQLEEKLRENGIEDALIKAIDYCDNVVTVEDMDSDQTLEIHGDDVDYELDEGDRIYV